VLNFPDEGHGFQAWSEAANVWNKQLRRSDKGWLTIKISMLRNVKWEIE
jgi:hypothetical protein